MSKIKIFTVLFTLVISQNLFAQIDTVLIRFIPDPAATYRIKCVGVKVMFDTDTTYTDFNLSDTTIYSWDWGGSIEPVEDGLPLVTYEFSDSGLFNFTLSVYEDTSGVTFITDTTYYIHDVVRVPNVFTPNGDGLNDFFIVTSSGEPDKPLEISIYSRTGTLVYSEKAPVIVWDGRSASGSEVSEGIYFYTLKTSRPEVPPKNGFFYLYRDKK